MDTPIKEPSYLVISWKLFISLCSCVLVIGGFVWRLFSNMTKLNDRVDNVTQLAEDIHAHEVGAQSLGKHLNLLLERMATVETKIEERDSNFREDIKEIKSILNRHFTWNGIDRRRHGNDTVD